MSEGNEKSSYAKGRQREVTGMSYFKGYTNIENKGQNFIIGN